MLFNIYIYLLYIKNIFRIFWYYIIILLTFLFYYIIFKITIDDMGKNTEEEFLK